MTFGDLGDFKQPNAFKPFNSKSVTLTTRGGFFTKFAALAQCVPQRTITLMPSPCSAFQSVNNFGNRLYPKEKMPGCALLFWIESVTKVVNRLKRITWTRHKTLDQTEINR